MRVFEARFDRGKQMDWKLVEKNCYNRREAPILECYYDENGVVHSQTNYEYDSKGREIKSTERLNGKVIYFCKTKYDKRDSVSKHLLLEPDQKLDFTIHVHYNKAGTNDKDVCINANGSVKFWDEYVCDKSGKLKKWIRYNPDSTVRSKVIYEYDKQGREIGNTCSGELGGTYRFKYNEKGLKSEETGYNTADGSFLWLQLFTYDDSNRIKKMVEYDDPKDRPKNPYKVVRYEYTFW